MSTAWIVILAVGAITIVLKAAGPLLVGSRPLPEPALRVIDLVAPVLLVALVVTQTVGGDEEIVLDGRLAGMAAAVIGLWRGLPLVAVMAIAAAVTAACRGLL